MNKGKETRSCGCWACRRGAGSTYGQAMHAQTNRRIRRLTRLALKKLGQTDDFVPIKGATPYTD